MTADRDRDEKTIARLDCKAVGIGGVTSEMLKYEGGTEDGEMDRVRGQ